MSVLQPDPLDVPPADPALRLDYVRLRLAVGSLGERVEPAWFQSGFMEGNAAPFLDPIFGPKRLGAQYSGVTEAARLVHDDRIGVGRVLHLFRLPELIEQLLAAEIISARVSELARDVHSEAWAMGVLTDIAPAAAEERVGPVRVGSIASAVTRTGLQSIASRYRQAFIGGTQCFPYFSDRP